MATAVIRYSERLASLWGFQELWLHVNVDNPGAQRLYEGLGYTRWGCVYCTTCFLSRALFVVAVIVCFRRGRRVIVS